MIITGLYTGLSAFILIFLAFKVIKARKENSINLGDQGNEAVIVAMRAQANFVEYAPIALLLLAIAESGGAPALFLHIVGALFFLARLAHAYGFHTGSGQTSPGRAVGAITTFLILLVLAVYNILHFAGVV